MEQPTKWLSSIRDLKLSYRKTHRILRKARDQAEINKDVATSLAIKEMMSDVNFAIEWMHSGRRPGSKRGIERRAGYQREKLIDPLRMQAYVANSVAASPSSITETERFQIQEALKLLTPQERECYLLAHGEGFPRSYISLMLGISKDSVKTNIKRAQKKISEEVQNSLFFVK